MSETLERRRERLAELEERDWVHTGCTRCGAGDVVCAPGREADALCGGCRLQDASLATAIQRLPVVAPPPMVVSGSEKILAQRGSEAVALEVTYPVCGPCCRGAHQAPGPVGKLEQAALGFGWRVVTWHGTDGWTVRFRRAGWMGYASYRAKAWDSVCVTGRTLPPYLGLGVTELKEWLAEPERCSAPAWLDAVRAKVAARELHSKIVRCPGASGGCVPVGPWEGPWPVLTAPARLDHTHRADGAIVKKVSRKEAVSGA